MRPLYLTLFCTVAALPIAWGFSEPSNLSIGVQQFGEKLEHVLEKPSENRIFSPWNIATLLGLTGEGAVGETEEAFWQLLGLPHTGDKKGFKELIEKLNQKGDFELSSATGIWLQSGLMFNPLFQQTAVEYFQSELGQENFKVSPENSRKEINRWVSEKTKHRIPELLKHGIIKTDTRIVLATALYMNAPFLRPFSINNSKEDSFTPSSGKAFPIVFLNQTGSYRYYENDDFQLVEIPYKSAPLDVVLWVMLPKQQMQPFDFKTFDALLEPASVELKLPRMEVRSTLDLKQPLIDLGLSIPFSSKADFSGMLKGNLELSTIVHEAWVAFDEKGTEAAAASGAIVVTRSMPIGKNVSFRADRPFSFMIWEKNTGIPLFQGHVDSPKPWAGREILEKNDMLD